MNALTNIYCAERLPFALCHHWFLAWAYSDNLQSKKVNVTKQNSSLQAMGGVKKPFCFQKSGIEPRVWTKEAQWCPMLSICSVSTKLATFPPASTPRVLYRVPVITETSRHENCIEIGEHSLLFLTSAEARTARNKDEIKAFVLENEKEDLNAASYHWQNPLIQL